MLAHGGILTSICWLGEKQTWYFQSITNKYMLGLKFIWNYYKVLFYYFNIYTSHIFKSAWWEFSIDTSYDLQSQDKSRISKNCNLSYWFSSFAYILFLLCICFCPFSFTIYFPSFSQLIQQHLIFFKYSYPARFQCFCNFSINWYISLKKNITKPKGFIQSIIKSQISIMG